MLELDVHAFFLGDTGHVHQTGAVWPRHITGTSLNMTLHLVPTHLGADGSLFYSEHTAETTALVGTLWLQNLNTLYQIQQILDLVERCHMFLTGRTQSQLAYAVAGIVQAHLVGELA